MGKLHVLYLLALVGLAASCTVPSQQTIGLLHSDAPKQEIDSISHFLTSSNYEVTELLLEELADNGVPEEVDVLWYHKIDSGEMQEAEINIGGEVKDFVKKGGSLMLTLEAVRLLNNWEIEPQPIEVSHAKIVDQGFGRKAGFHAFRHHSLFDGLNGGAYLWHAKKDHTVRKLGFYEDRLPQGPGGQVIGIDWAYITYHENSKLLWQYQLGAGNILAVGAYTYYSEPNFKNPHLQRFTINSLNYLLQGERPTDNFWTYEDHAPEQVADLVANKMVVVPDTVGTWQVPHSSETLSRKEATTDYYDLAGRRMLLMGDENAGFSELWAHPFMAFRDYQVAVMQDGSELVWLKDVPCNVSFTPSHMERIYTVGSTVLKEVSTVSLDKPTAQIHYEIEGNDIDHILIKATTNLRLMWPYTSHATGTIQYEWSDESLIWASTDKKTRGLHAMMGFSQMPVDKSIGRYSDVVHDSGQWQTEETDKNQLMGAFLFETRDQRVFDVTIAAGEESPDSLTEYYANLKREPQHEIQRSAGYYKQLLNSHLTIETPDSTFNEGYKWALLSTDQFMVETPGIGSSLVAGYGTTARGWNGFHEISGRPGYAWYFGRDAQWSSFAMNAYGGFDNVKEVLKTFVKFQDITGKIYHEMSTSGSVHYDASDATPGYIILAAHYLKYSGDIDFIRSIWPSLKRAIDYCYITDHDGDGLIDNTNVGHGWIEGGQLYGAKTTFFLAGMWAKTLEDIAYLARTMGEQELEKEYSADYEKVKGIVNNNFFNKETNFFNYSLEPDNTYNDEITVLPAVPVLFGVIDPDKAISVAGRYGYNDFSADWGVRILSQQSDLFSPGGYHYGSVWPLFGGWTSLAEYKYGHYTQGFMHIMNNLQTYKNWDLGSVDEVYHGLEYRPSGVCSHQCWSETMVLQPIVEGMLGLQPDAPNNALKLTPAIPWNWSFINIENIKVGEHSLTLKMKRNASTTTFDLANSKGEKALTVTLQPVLPFFTELSEILINGEEVGYTVYSTAQGLRLQIPAITVNGQTKVEINHMGGVGVIPVVPNPKPGEVSKSFRIVEQRVRDNSYEITFEGPPGSDHEFKVYAPDKLNAKGARVLGFKDLIHTFNIKFDKGKQEPFIKQKVILTAEK